MGVNVKIPLLVLMGNYLASFISWAQVTCITRRSAVLGEIRADPSPTIHCKTLENSRPNIFSSKPTALR